MSTDCEQEASALRLFRFAAGDPHGPERNLCGFCYGTARCQTGLPGRRLYLRRSRQVYAYGAVLCGTVY